jgi:hypothetical protein
MSSKRLVTVSCALAMLALSALLALNPGAAGAQDNGDIGINFIAFNCPNLETEPYSGCESPTSATFEILADGVALSGSPFTTGPTSLVPGFFFYAPAGATLTITELSVDPPGNAPAPGFDPLVVNVDDIPIGSCGGESTCPTIEFINLPFAIADGPAGEPPSAAEVSVLPSTGATPTVENRLDLPAVALLLALLCVATGLTWRFARSPNQLDG